MKTITKKLTGTARSIRSLRGICEKVSPSPGAAARRYSWEGRRNQRRFLRLGVANCNTPL